MTNELTWNEYIDLVKKECERRFDNNETYYLGLSHWAVPLHNEHSVILQRKIINNQNDYPYNCINPSRSLHLQPRLDWLESLKDKSPTTDLTPPPCVEFE